MEQIDPKQFIRLHSLIEKRMIEISEIKEIPVLRFDRKLVVNGDTLIYKSKDYDLGETKRSKISININEINQPDEYWIKQHKEEVRLAKEKEEERILENAREIESKERREYERLHKKFGPKKEIEMVRSNISHSDIVFCGEGSC